MAIFINELKQGFKALVIWTISIAGMLILCIIMFPEMKMQMNEVTDMFANMGGFTAAFGMDRLNFGELLGFYGVECGNILGIGGGFFAAYLGITVLSKEEKEHTAEFLLTHPVSRLGITIEKNLSVVVEILVMNLIIVVVSYGSIKMIGEDIDVKIFLLIHLAYLILQLEIGLICGALSAFLSRGSIGIGMGLAGLLYFMNIIRNLSDQGKWLEYITPFSYAETADIIEKGSLDTTLVLLGILYAVVAFGIGIYKYTHKDINA